MEWRQQAIIQSSIQTYFCRNLMIEVLGNIVVIHSLRRGGKTQKYLRLKLMQNLLISICHDMMSFIKHDIVIIIIWQLELVQSVIQQIL